MISFIRGILASKMFEGIEVEAGGIGYEILVPVSTFQNLPEKGKEVKIYTYESVAMYGGGTTLYGFLTLEERDIFVLLRSVSNIGTKGALDILSKVSSSFADFKQAIKDKDTKVLVSIFGLTKKTAEKLVLGLKDKIDEVSLKGEKKAGFADKQEMMDAISGLVTMGYRETESKEAVNVACKDMSPGSTAEDIIKKSLKLLRKG